ncbi:MAG: methyltransferase domain-containing protein [candidate division Zixibacteria bacterium]|nr:methyltransferase domain-containing protein [candidate division Zixibacteria bacterium]
MSVVLDLGCGPFRKMNDSIGVDIIPAPHVDLVQDLNAYPYPFEDGRFEHIEMSHILEHLLHPAQAMQEVWRIARPNATVRIVTPHYTSQLSYGDLTHYHHFGHVTFTHLCNGGRFRLERHRLVFTDFYRVVGIAAMANLFPRRWEKYVSFLFPALYVDVTLRVIK